MAARLAVSIINYRTAEMTIAAVRSVLEDLGTREACVVVVDNASGDGSDRVIADWISEAADPRVRFVRSETNSGFSGGNNRAIAEAPGAELYLLLNSDALLRPGFFDRMLAAVEAAPDRGLFAPRLEWDDGTPQQSCFRFHGPASEIIRSAGSGPVTRALRSHVVALSVDPDPAEIEWASFACILLRGDMVREIGPMDEGYFLYFEDAEYAFRARQAGWRIAWVPDARAVHFRGGSGSVKDRQAARKRLPAYYWRSRTRFFRQAYGLPGPFLANAGWLLGRGVAQVRRLLGHGLPPLPEGEWRDIWIGFAHPLRPDRAPGS